MVKLLVLVKVSKNINFNIAKNIKIKLKKFIVHGKGCKNMITDPILATIYKNYELN